MAKPDRNTFQNRLNELMMTLRQAIHRGTYQPGDFLPAETALAEQFHLSKNSVRIALDKLLEEGLIVKLPRVGTQVAPRPQRTVLRFGFYPSLYEETDISRVIELFEEQYPHISVKPLELPYTRADSIKMWVEHGILDVMTLNFFDYLHFREKDSLHLLEGVPPDPETYPFLNDMFATAEGNVAVRPFIFSPVVLCYNKEHFHQQRLFEPDSSWDWQDLRQALRKLKAPNRFGLFFQLTNRWPIFLLQNGVRFERDEEGFLSPADPGMLNTLRYIRDLIHEDGLFPLVMSFGEHNAEQLFKQQKVSVILTTYFRLNQLADADFPFDIAQVPQSKSRETLLLSTGIAVGAMSPNKEAAACFTDFLLSEQVHTLIRRHSFSLPSNKRVTETVSPELPNKPSRLELHREMIPNYATHERLQLSTRELHVFGECLEQYFSELVDEEGLMRLFNKQLSAGTELLSSR